MALLTAGLALAAGASPGRAQADPPGPVARGASPAHGWLPILEDPAGSPRTDPPPPSDTLSLAEALRTALEGSPDVRDARVVASATGTARWADWGAFLPTFSASMSVARSDVRTVTFLTPAGFFDELPQPESDVNKGVAQTLSLIWTVFEGGRRIADLAAGAAASRAARLRLSGAERRVVAEVKSAFFEARKQQRLVAIARRHLASRRWALEQSRRRYRIAAVDRADLLGARVEVRRAELSLLESEDAAERARRRLRVVTGRRGGRAGADAVPDAADFALEDVPVPSVPAGLSRDALAERALAVDPGLRALAAEVDRASARVRATRSRYLPTVRVAFSHDRSEQFTERGDLLTFDPANRTDRFSVSVSWDLFTGFRRREESARARAELQRTRAQRLRRRLEVEATVRDLAGEVERRARRVELLRCQLEAVGERLRVLAGRYRDGSARVERLHRAIDDVIRTERDLVRERHDWLGAWARLERWAGLGLPGPPGPEAGDEGPERAKRGGGPSGAR